MSAYLQYLIWMMLFVIVLEMIFPDMAYRKYIKLVLGCILVYTMLQPVLSLIRVDGANYEDYVIEYQNILGTLEDGQASYKTQLESQQESLESFYEQSIKQCVEQQAEVSVKSLSLTMREGEVEKINLVVGEKEKEIKIGTIHIGDKAQTINGDEENLKNKIKTCLHDFYNVQVCNIYITVQKN